MQFWINNQLALRGVLRQYTEPIDVTTALPPMSPDPGWSAVDSGGHFHAFAADGALPTLTYPGDSADRSPARHSCRICGEMIEPRYVPGSSSPIRRYVAGPQSWTVTADLSIKHLPLGLTTHVIVRVRPDGQDAESALFGLGAVTQVRVETTHATIRVEGAGELHGRMAL